ncbi:MAG TPA: hypothetical protein EYN67_06900 [Flavobacteriales bacterium]|nr:hypothetical protein [Flavobacteriales bacterium]
MESKEIKFYQNNPCLIIRDVNELFCEIQLNTHFAANIEAEHYCTPSECRSPMSSGEAAQEEYDQAQAILEDIQDEEHSIICMIEKRLLHDAPIEANTINSLTRHIDDQKFEFESTKILHAEWQQAVNCLKSKADLLNSEIQTLELTREASFNINKTAKAGIDKLQEKYNAMLVYISDWRGKDKFITKSEHASLLATEKKMAALEKGGVDNWEWYEDSLKNAGLIDND